MAMLFELCISLLQSNIYFQNFLQCPKRWGSHRSSRWSSNKLYTIVRCSWWDDKYSGRKCWEMQKMWITKFHSTNYSREAVVRNRLVHSIDKRWVDSWQPPYRNTFKISQKLKRYTCTTTYLKSISFTYAIEIMMKT